MRTAGFRVNAALREVGPEWCEGARTNGGRCVLDGLAYVALCGASAGEAFEVAVAVDSVPVAVQLGFAFADDYPDRKPLPCK